MIINHKHKFIFIHIPKTGGTSISNYCIEKIEGSLYNRINEDSVDINKHIYAKELIDIFDYSNYNSFAVVRNPFEVTVSHYFFGLRVENLSMDEYSFEDFLELMVKPNAIRQPMVEYISDGSDILIKDIVRFENLESELKSYFNKISLNLDSLGRHNIGNHLHYSKYYNEKTYNIVNDYFSEDIKKFNYKF